MATALRRAELKPSERVHRDGVRFNAGDVAEHDLAGLGEKRTDAVTEAGEIGTGDGAADGEGDLVRPGCRQHLPL